MRTNKTKVKLKAGKAVFGLSITFPSPDLVEILGYCGADFLHLDTEHSSTSYETLIHMVRAAELSGVTPLVSVPESLPGQYAGLILKVLDLGAMGVIVPHVESKLEAQSIVDAARYFPEGKRGMFGSGRAISYGLQPSVPQYIKEANEETMVVVKVESSDGIKNIDEILSVPGIDVLTIGPNDLAQSMGYPSGKHTEPAVIDAVHTIIRRARAAGVAVGVGVPFNFPRDVYKGFLDAGVQFVNFGGIAKLIVEGTKQWMKWLDDIQRSS